MIPKPRELYRHREMISIWARVDEVIDTDILYSVIDTQAETPEWVGDFGLKTDSFTRLYLEGPYPENHIEQHITFLHAIPTPVIEIGKVYASRTDPDAYVRVDDFDMRSVDCSIWMPRLKSAWVPGFKVIRAGFFTLYEDRPPGRRRHPADLGHQVSALSAPRDPARTAPTLGARADHGHPRSRPRPDAVLALLYRLARPVRPHRTRGGLHLPLWTPGPGAGQGGFPLRVLALLPVLRGAPRGLRARRPRRGLHLYLRTPGQGPEDQCG